MSVLFVGAANLDTVIHVEQYPAPDTKIRAVRQSVEGGGNAANSANAASQLGVRSAILSAVGDDYASQTIIEQLNTAGVVTDLIARKTDTHSGTTSVIVCKADSTRTCIHNAMLDELQSSDIDELYYQQAAPESFAVVHLDSRHTKASAYLCSRIIQTHGLITIDAEKVRPGIYDLFPFCDVIFCNEQFPTLCCESPESARWVMLSVTTSSHRTQH
jgi:sugar/nucleoside kinase (ribokinase family)